MNTDLVQLATQLTKDLKPFLPYLLAGVQLAGKEAAKKTGEKIPEWMESAWRKLATHPNIQEAAEDIVAAPQDEDALAALRLQIKKALEQNPVLTEEIKALMPDVQSIVQVDEVASTGEVTGVEVEEITNGSIDSWVEAGEVKGKLTGVSIKKMGK